MSTPLVLLNPHAGAGRAARLQQPLAQWLQQHAPDAVLAAPPSVEQALERLAQLPPSSRVVVVGGDGTLNRLLPALLLGGHTLGLVPCGSGNDTARALGLYRAPWAAALQHGLLARASAMDLGLARFQTDAVQRSVPFLSSFTVGFDSAVSLRALQGPRWLGGLPRYLLATLRELLDLRTWELQVQADGENVHQGTALFASTLNTPTFGSGMPAVPHAHIDDGRLDLLVAGRFGRGATLLMLPRLLAGLHLGHPRVHTRTFSRLTLQARKPVPLAADGEYLGETPALELQVLPGALAVVRGPLA
jgi:diacylglycerol kinase family enzyme